MNKTCTEIIIPEGRLPHEVQNFRVLANIIQMAMVRETGTPNIDVDLVNSVAWDVAVRLGLSLYIPDTGSLEAAKSAQPDGQPLRAEISPARREIFRQNIEDCFNPKKQPDSLEKLEVMYRSHVSELLNEMERLEFLLSRIVTEYLADKATLQDEKMELIEAVARIEFMNDLTANTATQNGQ